MMRLLFSLATSVTVLAGCAAYPPSMQLGKLDAANEAPSRWSATRHARAGIDTQWVRRFRDKRLENLVEEAEQRNPDMRIAESRVREAAQTAKSAGAAMKPWATLNLTGNRRKTNFVGFPFGDEGDEAILSNRSNAFGASLDVNWEIDLWGRIRAGQSAMLAASQAAAQDFRGLRASLAAQVAKSWFALIEANEQVDLATESLAVMRSTESSIRNRFESGAAPTSVGAELRLAQSDVAAAEARLEQLGEVRMKTVRQLETLLGRYPDGKLTAARSLPDTPSPPPAGLPSEMLLRRPDVLAAERRFAARLMRVKEAKLALFPRLNLTSSAGTSTDALRDILTSDFGVWSIGAGVAQSILTGGRLWSEMKIRDEQSNQAIHDLHKKVLNAFNEVETALAAEAYLARREAALKRTVDLARQADSRAREDYADGVGDLLTVLATQNRLLSTRAELITLRRLRLDNRVNIHLALGGDYVLHQAKNPSS